MDNTYNIDFIARCISGHNKTAIKSITTELENVQKQVGGVSLVEITQEDFDALTDKDPSTIYLVSNGDKITLYIGGTEVNVQSDWTQTTITADDYIKNKPTLGTAAAKNATDTYNATGTDVTTGKAVAEALATLPEPMVFKGSLGTDGTITTLPTASSSNKGYVYKVITADTYASQSAKVGDTFISDGSAWVLIPSGDEPSGTVTNVAVANGGGLTVSGSPITTSGTITVGHSNSVTAKTSSSLKKFAYDAYGHVTDSSELSTDESNALASGIDSTKVAQITTNKNNITLLTANGGGKNYFNPQSVTYEPSDANVTYSLSGDTITLSVTASSNVSELSIRGINFPLNKDLVLTGCPANTGYTIQLDAFNNSDHICESVDTGSGSQPFRFTTMTDSRLRIRIGTNTSFTNLQFKIMVRDSNTDSTYQPYAMSNAELTSAIQALQAQLANQ